MTMMTIHTAVPGTFQTDFGRLQKKGDKAKESRPRFFSIIDGFSPERRWGIISDFTPVSGVFSRLIAPPATMWGSGCPDRRRWCQPASIRRVARSDWTPMRPFVRGDCSSAFHLAPTRLLTSSCDGQPAQRPMSSTVAGLLVSTSDAPVNTWLSSWQSKRRTLGWMDAAMDGRMENESAAADAAPGFLFLSYHN